MRHSRCLILVLALLVPRLALAQQRPLVTEDPETIGSGLILLEGGFEQQYRVFYPASGLTGDLLRLPTLGVSIGVSSIAEIQIDGGVFNHLSVNERQSAPLGFMLDFAGDDTSDVEDLVIGAKVRLVAEGPGHPAVGVRFATKLPFASNESGLGLGTTDFYTSFLIGKTVQSIRVVSNVGLAFLGDPIRGDRLNESMTYGLSFARAVAQGAEIVGELNGRFNLREWEDEAPPGTDTRSALRFGARFTHKTVRIDGGVIIGLTSRDPSFGFTGGFTWVFRGFTVP